MRVPLIKIALMAALLVAVSASTSWALIEQYLPGGTSIVMKFTNYDEGTRYNPAAITPGALYTRPGEPGYNPLYDLGTLRADPLTQLPTGGFPGEDSWGILRLKEIDDVFDNVLWSSQWLAGDPRLVTVPFEVTVMFAGLQDQSLLFDGTTQFIKGTDLEFGFFEDTTPDFTQLAGPGARTGFATYPTVTDGTLFWTGNSVVGDPMAAPYEFLSQFTPGATPDTDTGKGEFFGQAAGNAFGVGSLNNILEDLGGNIEFKFQFTADTKGAAPWDLKSEDPVNAEITPELSPSALLLLGMLPFGLGWLRRRKA